VSAEGIERAIDLELKNKTNITTDQVFEFNKKELFLEDVSFKNQRTGVSKKVVSKKSSKGVKSKNKDMLSLSTDNLLQRETYLNQSSFDKAVLKNKFRSGLSGRRSRQEKKGDKSVKGNDIQNLISHASVFSKVSISENNDLEQETRSNDAIAAVADNVNEKASVQEEDLVINSIKDSVFIVKKKEASANNIGTSSGVVISQNNPVSKEVSIQEEECVEEEVEFPVEKTIEEAIAVLEEQLNEEENKEEEVVFNKWKIAPNIAPVYYNTLSAGSPIDSELSVNKKKGKINLSYGIGVGYAINKKLTIRTGVNKISLGYSTQDVAIYPVTESPVDVRGLRNVTLTSESSSLNLVGSSSYSVSQIPSSFSLLFDSSLNQRFGYLEVPVELSYKISNKKMKIAIIAGMSTFFLNENDIFTVTNGVETHIGEANNLNKISYSTNVGLGFNYEISKAFNFSFEPMFKYQLNAFSNDSGNFKPYILGVYTGLSFKF